VTGDTDAGRDAIRTLGLEDLAGPANATAAERKHRLRDLLDTTITSLFAAGLSLQATMDLPTGMTEARITAALSDLAEAIRAIRDADFTAAAAAHRPIPHRSTAPGEDSHA
jgi:hypothetical protein